LLRLITGKVRTLANRVNEFTTLAIRERLIMELLRLSKSDQADPRTAVVSPPPIHADLAGRISTRRETVTKELIAMEREGLVRRSRGALTLVDVPRLLAIIAEDTESQDFKA
jgi:DNA-binding MarR family transcriptional regulator